MTHADSRFDKLGRDQQQLVETLRTRLSTPYTTPAARMAPLAALLLRDPNVMCHALIEALDAIKGEGPRNFIINHLAKEAAK